MGFDWLFEGQNASRLAQGLWLTIQISVISVLFSLIGGVALGLLMRANNKIIRFLCQCILETVRIVPILVWLFVFGAVLDQP